MGVLGVAKQVWTQNIYRVCRNKFVVYMHVLFLVTGDANFTMEKTNLVVAGFSQPSVSRALIEFPGNTEKGLSQRFLWIFPKPSYSHFATLESINELFTESVGEFTTHFNIA